MSDETKGTFTPIHRTLPDPSEPDWAPPEDIPSEEEIKSILIRSHALEDGVVERESGQDFPKPTDEVDAKLRDILVAIESRIADLNKQGAYLFQASNYTAAAEKAERGKVLSRFIEKLRAIQMEWTSIAEPANSSGRPTSTGKLPTTSGHKRSAPKKLVVTFDDGTTIREGSSSETFALCIEKIGVEKIKGLGLERYGLPLLSAMKSEKYSSAQIGDLYLITHFNAEDKRAILRSIGELIGISLNVSIE
jgi:hypothetical protein